ncbi:3-keto-disaccharide hydrolase [Planctomicrobium piriforme]|uniref:3-keto-alpha-glucoside-1,2-lyase/3-keto-2-hydroxy-glucal hydratase domain-containing protein n=1 Tax=Planctomicrobium piriforme TaxID=1576369 RepID=A0A1I3DI68_9PLAN|nr:DUF1080 domain-containing protein [Planctomicrobium piriforme]SFH86356.1 protein of unknown function [Planctomicrobium piriforme]
MRTTIPGFLVLAALAGCTPAPQEPPKAASPPAPLPVSESVKSHLPSQAGEVLEADFQPLLLEQFTPFQGESGTWTTGERGVIQTSGIPKGYLHSNQPYENFTLRGDFQFVLTEEQAKNPAKANTGFMLAIQEPHKVWPRSLEVQGRWDNMGSINSNGGLPAPVTHDDPAVRERVRRPATDWNSIEIVMKDGAITSRLNGEVVCTSEPAEETQGFIGLQAEGFVVRFRNLRIRTEPAGERPPLPAP